MAYGLLAMSLNLLVGLTGLVSFGHAAYFASGAYMFGLLMQTGQVSIPRRDAGDGRSARPCSPSSSARSACG